jgi:hypothetical protein
MLEYTATPVAEGEGGVNDRVSDLNNFWNATDVRSPEDLFATPRGGALDEYDHLTTYYSGYGANYRTARLRLHRSAALHRRPFRLPDRLEPFPDQRVPDLAAHPETSLTSGVFRIWRTLWEWLISPPVNPFLRSRRSHSKVNHGLLWQTIRRVTAKQ